MGSKSGQFRHFLMHGVSLLPLTLSIAIRSSTYQAQAQDAEPVAVGQVQDVVVTMDENAGQQLIEKANAEPRSTVVVTPETTQREQLIRLTDFAQKVPSYHVDGGHPRRPATIRGVGLGAGTGDGAESDTGYVVDNVFWKDFGFQWGDYIDIAAFELRLGPQGTAFGKNTTVGNVVIHTQLPSFARGAIYEQTYGNYNHFIEKLNVTGPIIDDKLAYRVALYRETADGWIHDQVTGVGYLNTNRWGIHAQLLYDGGTSPTD
jgi:iron complex outermembrane receptor protein